MYLNPEWYFECASCRAVSRGSPAQAGRWAGKCLNHSGLEEKALGKTRDPVPEQNCIEVRDIHYLQGQELKFSIFGKE